MKTIELKDFIDFTYVSSLEASADGKHLAFITAKANLDENSYDTWIQLLDPATGQIRQLTSLGKEKAARWLDEKTLLFISNRDKKLKERIEKGEPWTVFYRISIHGGEATEAFRIPKNVTSYQIINHQYLALTVQENPNEPDVHSLPDDQKEKWFKKHKENKDYEVLEEIPFWANGGGFTSGKRNRLYLYDMKNHELTLLSNAIDQIELLDSKDGKILYAFQPFVNKMGLTDGLAVYDIETKEHQVLIESNHYSIHLAKFVQNSIIVNLSDMKAAGMNTNGDFYRLDGKSLTFLAQHDYGLGNTVGSDARYGSMKTAFASDNRLYFISTEEYASFVKYVDLEGNMETVTKGNGSVAGITMCGNEIYLIAMYEQLLCEIYRLDQETKDVQRLTHYSDAIFENKYVAVPKPIRFESHGVPFTGFVLEPKDFDPAKKYPAILDIHGGPKTVYGTIYYHEMQVWANMGYFVFFTNPTGSDGRGNAFMDIRGKYGTVDYDDLMTFTDVVLDAYPQIDRSRVGVTGGSYGGFMTNWIIGHTDRFACAASQRSISNWISKFGTTDIGYFFNADQIGATPWDDVDKMWWHSPLKYADRVKTPTLFIHSEEDYRCWLAEGLQMFTALKYHGVEARLCMFRKENHELSRSGMPKHRIRRLEEITNWFEQYLKK